jgi:secretory phospholipase A2
MPSLEACPDRKPKPNHRPSANGCGPEKGVKVPDRPLFLANFKPACDFHDICYETCNVSKDACDEAFRRKMVQACVAETFVTQNLCVSIAQTYYEFVRDFGGGPYEDAQKAACNCC